MSERAETGMVVPLEFKRSKKPKSTDRALHEVAVKLS